MANDILWNDEEKVEQIKKWWKSYGNYLVTGVLFVVLVMVAWKYWHVHEQQKAAQASIAYENLLVAQQHNQKAVAGLAQQLISNYEGTPYADFAAFYLAKQAVAKKDYQTAEQQLQWVMDHSAAKTFEQLARIRLARIMLVQNHPSKALDILTDETISYYPGLAATLRGDVYVATNKLTQAHKAYQIALKELPKQSAMWPIVEMKLDDLPESN